MIKKTVAGVAIAIATTLAVPTSFASPAEAAMTGHGTPIAQHAPFKMWNPCAGRCKISRCKWAWWKGTYRCV